MSVTGSVALTSMPVPSPTSPSWSAASATGSMETIGRAPRPVAAASRPPSSSSGTPHQRNGATRGAAARGVTSAKAVICPRSVQARTVALTGLSPQACAGTTTVAGTSSDAPGASETSGDPSSTDQAGSARRSIEAHDRERLLPLVRDRQPASHPLTRCLESGHLRSVDRERQLERQVDRVDSQRHEPGGTRIDLERVLASRYDAHGNARTSRQPRGAERQAIRIHDQGRLRQAVIDEDAVDRAFRPQDELARRRQRRDAVPIACIAGLDDPLHSQVRRQRPRHRCRVVGLLVDRQVERILALERDAVALRAGCPHDVEGVVAGRQDDVQLDGLARGRRRSVPDE